MKHKIRNKTLGRNSQQRRQLLRNLTSSLLEHGSIVTTRAKGKEMRVHVDPLITLAREDTTLHRRRQLLRRLGRAADLPVLLKVAQQHKNRPGGYLRLTRMPNTRTDGAEMVRVDLVGNKIGKKS